MVLGAALLNTWGWRRRLVNGQQFIEQVTISNLLPAFDERLGGALEYVEVFASTAPEGADDRSGQLGPYRLSAAYTTGSEVTLPVLRLGGRHPR